MNDRLVALLAMTPPANTANIPVIWHFYNDCEYIMRHSFNIAAHASNNNTCVAHSLVGVRPQQC